MARCQGPGNGGRGKGGRGPGESDRAVGPDSRTPRRTARSPAGGGRGAGAAGGEGALREPPERRGAQASSAIHSCTEARAELLIAAIVTRGRCGSRASTLARDKWPLTAPPRQESSSDFTARRLSGLCLARFPVRTFKSASRPSLLSAAAPRLLRPRQGPGRVARRLWPPPRLGGGRGGELREDPGAAGEATGAPRPGSAPPPERSPAPRLRAHKMDQATVRRAGCKYLKSLSRAGGNGFRSRNVC